MAQARWRKLEARLRNMGFTWASGCHVSAGIGLTDGWSPPRDSVGLGWGLRICISNKLPVDAGTAGLGTALREPMTGSVEPGPIVSRG